MTLQITDIVEDMTSALGEAVVECWNTLPHDVQQMVFEAAVAARNKENGFRGGLALFLHDHNPRTSDAVPMDMPDDVELPPLFPSGRPENRPRKR